MVLGRHISHTVCGTQIERICPLSFMYLYKKTKSQHENSKQSGLSFKFKGAMKNKADQITNRTPIPFS